MCVITTIAVDMSCDSPSQENNCQTELTSTISSSHKKCLKEQELNTFKVISKKVNLDFITCNIEDLYRTTCNMLAKQLVGHCKRLHKSDS